MDNLDTGLTFLSLEGLVFPLLKILSQTLSILLIPIPSTNIKSLISENDLFLSLAIMSLDAVDLGNLKVISCSRDALLMTSRI